MGHLMRYLCFALIPIDKFLYFSYKITKNNFILKWQFDKIKYNLKQIIFLSFKWLYTQILSRLDYNRYNILNINRT